MKEPGRDEAVRNNVQAQVKAVVAVRRGSDGIGPNAALAVDLNVHGDELTGLILELGPVARFELEVFGPIVGVPDVTKISCMRRTLHHPTPRYTERISGSKRTFYCTAKPENSNRKSPSRNDSSPPWRRPSGRHAFGEISRGADLKGRHYETTKPK